MRITGAARPRVLLLPPHRSRTTSADAKTHHEGRKSLPATADPGRRQLHPNGADASDGGAAARPDDNKLAGLLLYGLQIASSNLQHGANFAQGQSATVAGSYDNFEQDYDLADTDCGLRVPEEEEEHEAKAGEEIDRAVAVPAAPLPQRVQKDAGRQGFLVRFRPQNQNDDTQLAEKAREVA